jgi:small GTP-binding protein
MVQSIEQLEQSVINERLASLYSYIHKQNNINLEKKLKQLAEKAMYQEYSIAFCGHFSAGKSTMINRLIGENILPSSPIPTSANLVKVKKGEEYAKVYFKKEKPRMYLPPYNYDQVKNYCKDGDQIEWVEISHADSNLPEGMVVLDTPGIDSTDDAHRIATESAIHLADLILYVMDYNHVQSEVNFLFTKDLAIAGKEIYLVINQIDKHRNEELSFEAFKKSVEDSFASWGVYPKGIFYTSLRQADNPHNQFQELQSFIHERIEHIDTHLKKSLLVSLNQLGGEYLSSLEEQNEEQERMALERLNELSVQEQEQLEEKEAEITGQLTELESSLEEAQKTFQKEMDKILKSAYLMPFQTRELAESFLQANQEGFKVGFLFSKQKTETEREERLTRFYEDLNEKVSTQLDWHIRSHFQQAIKEHHIKDQAILQACQNYETPFTKEVLVKNVKPGAVLSGEYLLNYTNDVVADITRGARKGIEAIYESLFKEMKLNLNIQLRRLEEERSNWEPYLKAKKTLTELDSMLTAEKEMVDDLLAGKELNLEFLSELFTPADEDVEIVKDNQPLHVQSEDIELDVEGPPVEKINIQTVSKEKLVSKLFKTANELRTLNGFNQTANDLFEKASRIENQGFTVALFGAFSAGKSSFANALMGADVLPVSPNPTTAAINKILPVSEQYPHGTVRVKLKDADNLLSEVARSLKVFELQANDFQEALAHIKKIITQSSEITGNEKVHFSFLQAFQAGFGHLSNSLGQVIKTDLEEFREFVANETKSCFVEWIELYYDCELTQKGITLVDTPGADSINARHTGVAFDYIKNSDAILFVTYYNHAFSKADREFLIQLGRVKETFELDKMFFIINAVDLANDEEEAQSVVSYVKSQLNLYGIRQPNLFALSSLLALKEKLNANNINPSSNMKSFEDSFYHFIANDLLQTSLSSAESDLQRVIHDIELLIEASNANENEKMARKKQLLIEKESVKTLIQKQSVGYWQSKVTNELEELIFYIKQRVFLRFNDFFKESFNPAVIKDDGRNLKKALNGALEEFLLSLGYDFAQELRATSLRMDAFLRKQMEELHHSLTASLKEVNKDLTITKSDFQQNRQLEFVNAFEHLDRSLFQKAMATFKNPKAFFEKNEKTKMSDELQNVLQQPAEDYLSVEGIKLKELYNQLLEELFVQKLEAIHLEIDTFYERYVASLEDKGQAEELSRVLKVIV